MTKDGVISSSTRRAHYQNIVTPTSNAHPGTSLPRRGVTPTAESGSGSQSAGGVGTRRAGLRSAQTASGSHNQQPERAVKDANFGQQTLGRGPAPATPQEKPSSLL